MAGPYYVRSTDGNDADSGLTWALAKATLAGALAIAAAGERIWVSQVHAETTAGAITLTSAGTAAAPIEILCGNDAAEPPTALATTATVSTTGANSLLLAGGYAYVYGITFSAVTGGAGSNVVGFATATEHGWFMDACVFQLGGTSATLRIAIGLSVSGTPARVDWKNCNVIFGNVAQGISLRGTVHFHWCGGIVAPSGSVPTTLFLSPGTYPHLASLSGVNISALGAGTNLVNAAAAIGGRYIFANCKLGASVSLTTGTPTGHGGIVVVLDNCDSADTNYRMQRHQYEGNIYSETTLVRTGGASDGTTGLSHKMVSSANTKFYAPLYGPEMVVWNDAVGSSQTVTCEIVHDSVTNLQDDEVWLETEYLGTSGFPLSLFANDRMADILATPADQAASSVTWTTTGLTNPNKQKLVTTQTPQEKGWYRCRVALAKPSYTVYVCPELAIDDVVVSGVQRLVPGGAYANERLGRGPEFRGTNL